MAERTPMATVVDALRTLVGFDTVSDRSNLPAVHWLAERLEDAGGRLRLTHDETGAKANLLAVFGPDRPGGVVLSGHTDVVPIGGQDWSTDPFVLTERDGRLHGRGTADMKGFVAACVAAAPAWAALPLRRPILVALSYDEEVGCLGVPHLIADMLAHVTRPMLALVGEPTGLRLGLQHRGFLGMRTCFVGRAAHSGEPEQGASAILPAASFAQHLASLARGAPDDPGRTTCNVGLIRGGTGINVVPAACEVIWECRPGTAAAEADLIADAETWLRDRLPAGVSAASQMLVRVPPLDAAPAGAAASLVRAWGGLEPQLAMPFGTEAGCFAEAGIPAVVCGPGSIRQAHQPDEWIEPGQLAAATLLLERVGQWASNELGQQQ